MQHRILIYIQIWFINQNSKYFEKEDKVNLTRIINQCGICINIKKQWDIQLNEDNKNL